MVLKMKMTRRKTRKKRKRKMMSEKDFTKKLLFI